MDSKRIDIGVGIALCILSVAIFLYAEQYAGKGVNRYGPNFFPQALSVMLFLTSVALIIQAFRGHALKGLETINGPGLIRAAVTLVISVAYLLIMKVLGFYISTALFLYVVMMYLGQKNQWVRILTSILVASAVYGIFHFFLKIPLPEGIFKAAL